MVGKELKQLHVVLESTWKLVHELMHTVKPLYENGASLTFVDITLYEVPTSQLELMAKLDPVLLDEGFETCQCSVVWIQDELHKTAQLSSPIPSIRAMDQNIHLLISQSVSHACRSLDQFPYVVKPLVTLNL